MRIALVDGSPKKSAKLYPLPLLKIGAWRQSLGDECELFLSRLPEPGDFDEIWITTRFTYDVPFAVGMVKEARNRAGAVRVGGISATLLPEHFDLEGVDVHRGLLPDAEQFAPDYSLLGHAPEYSISHTSRGCIRKCKFCMVPKLEPQLTTRRGWERDIHPATTKVLFYDNNWLAKDHAGLDADVEQLRAMVDDGRIKQIDFNQGLDARLMTEGLADLLKGLPIKPVRFAFDGMHEDGHYQRAVEMMAARGFRIFRTYVLYNFKDKPTDFYYRLKESVRLADRLKMKIESFPMRFQPILDIDSGRDYVGKYWTAEKRKGFFAIGHEHFGATGVLTPNTGIFDTDVQEFEYWYGKDAAEFDRLISYPKIWQLARRKKGALRMRRAKANLLRRETSNKESV